MLTSYKCPNCDASIPFDASSGKLKCSHCGTEYDIENLEAYNAELNVEGDVCDWNVSENQEVAIDGKVSLVCPACGGEVIGDANTSATTCPYCGTPIVNQEQLSGILKPDLIIPFKLTKEDAKKAYIEHIKGKLFLPNDFSVNNIIDKLNGMYVPYWLFDCSAKGQARYRATRTRMYRQGDYQITETSYYLVHRDGQANFEKVPVDASTRLDDSLLDAIEPFNYSEAKQFNSAYLSSYLADKYDQDEKVSITKANERIKNSLEMLLRSSVIGYDTVIPVGNSVQLNDGKANYALLPVYLFTTKYQGKVYQFAMNGQTGKFVGDLPMDKGKAFKYCLMIFAISFIILFLFFYMRKGI